jgi:hypothetical protein
MPPKINLAALLLRGFRSFVRSHWPLIQVERSLSLAIEAITVLINSNSLLQSILTMDNIAKRRTES